MSILGFLDDLSLSKLSLRSHEARCQPGCQQDAKLKVTDEMSHKSLRHITMKEVTNHCHSNACWVVIDDLVYDVTDFLIEHPGGEDIILENAGRDATVPFSEVSHSTDATTLLHKYCIGQLSQDDRPTRRSSHDHVTVGS